MRALVILVVRLVKAVTFSVSKTVINVHQGVSVFNILILKIIATMKNKVVHSIVLKGAPDTFIGPVCMRITIVSTLTPFLLLSVGGELVRDGCRALCTKLVFLVSSIKLNVFATIKMSAK